MAQEAIKAFEQASRAAAARQAGGPYAKMLKDAGLGQYAGNYGQNFQSSVDPYMTGIGYNMGENLLDTQRKQFLAQMQAREKEEALKRAYQDLEQQRSQRDTQGITDLLSAGAQFGGLYMGKKRGQQQAQTNQAQNQSWQDYYSNIVNPTGQYGPAFNR